MYIFSERIAPLWSEANYTQLTPSSLLFLPAYLHKRCPLNSKEWVYMKLEIVTHAVAVAKYAAKHAASQDW